MLQGFPPKINRYCRILILGSFPSVKSLKAGQYYANPLNQFWRIMAGVLDEPLPEGYEKRINILLKRGIALWDVVKTCERKGSADSKIIDCTVNDIPALLKKYSIKKVLCNGQKSHTLFKKNFESFAADILPSSSSAMAKPLSWKISQWRAKMKSA